MMELSKKGMAYIIASEGMTPQPYLDDYPGGTWTIGIGVTGSDGVNIKALRGKDPLTIPEMIDQFKKKINRYEDDVNDAIHVPISQQQFDALVSFHYNTGAIRKATLTKLINSGASSDRVIASLKQWTRSNGHFMRGLLNRRNSEAKIYLQGEYGPSKAVYMEANYAGKQLRNTAKYVEVMDYL